MSKFDLSKIDVSKIHVPHIETPNFDVSKFDVSKLEAKLDLAKKAAKAAQEAGLATYLPQKEKKPSALNRILHDLGLAVWFGGSVFGILSLNPSVEVLDDPEERGKMVDEAWARFQPYGALGLLVALISHVSMQRKAPKRPTARYKSIAPLKDFFMVGACITSVASLALGEYAVDDYTPVESATEAASETPDDKQKAQSGLSIASIAQLACGVGVIICAAILASEREK